MKGVLLDRASVDNGDLDLSQLETSLDDWSFFDTTTPGQVTERLKGSSVVVCNKVVLDEDRLSAAPEIDLICVTATGVNNIDLEAARKRGIAVTNVTAYATASVVQHVFSLILALRTRMFEYQRAVKAGKWQQSPFFCLLDYPISEIAGQTMGIIGYGELGKAVAGVARAFGMEVLVCARPGSDQVAQGRVSLEELLRYSDIISLHCPLDDNTRGLLGKNEFDQMKEGAILINTARGGIVDEASLMQALEDEVIAGAGIDVIEKEPPVNGNILLQANRPNLIVTPHIAWASTQSRQRLINEVAKNIEAYKIGEERNRII